MANHRSAEKRDRQSIKRRERNRSRVSRLRTQIKKLRAAVEAGEQDKAREMLPGTLGLIDRTAQKGAIHANAAARRKSRLTKLVQGAQG
ncbi:MAG: 30S ribosomal protein S20 [Acidobacteria bacterium]|nr:MAG: 30S ribosomal protein S20 [Acidobacteriota bacterium]REK01126.1 MAG: 30S ribosomal protein S20 [Acidobacteriota bacterium]